MSGSRFSLSRSAIEVAEPFTAVENLTAVEIFQRFKREINSLGWSRKVEYRLTKKIGFRKKS